MENLAEIINKYGFPVVCAAGMGYFVFYIWKWVTTVIKPVISQANATLIALIDRIRMLDNDVLQLRGKTIDKERILAEQEINEDPFKKRREEELRRNDNK